MCISVVGRCWTSFHMCLLAIWISSVTCLFLSLIYLFFFRFFFSQGLVRVLFPVVIGPLLVICKYIPQYNTCLLTVYSKFLQIKILKFLYNQICLFILGSGFPVLFFNGFPKFLRYFKKCGRGIS